MASSGALQISLRVLFFFECLVAWLLENKKTPASMVIKILETEFENGADIEKYSARGWNLMLAATSMGRDDILNYLIKRGGNVNAKSQGNWNRRGLTCLRLSLGRRDLEPHQNVKCAEILLEAGADVKTRNRFNSSLLFSALRFEICDYAVPLLLPYVGVERRYKFVVEKYVKKELSRLQAVKETLRDIFHDQLLEEVCDFLVSEEKMKRWLRLPTIPAK